MDAPVTFTITLDDMINDQRLSSHNAAAKIVAEVRRTAGL